MQLVNFANSALLQMLINIPLSPIACEENFLYCYEWPVEFATERHPGSDSHDCSPHMGENWTDEFDQERNAAGA
jgi:hypothetical protein